MTIDQRLEALTQTVELLASMHKDNEARLATLQEETNRRFAETLVFINRLAHVAEAHEQRLDDLENR